MIEHYNVVLKVGYQLQQALSNAMTLCQSWGYNGLKRYYRYHHRHFDNWCLLLKNEMFDRHEIVAPLEHGSYSPYNPTNLKEHSQRWLGTLKDACKQVAVANVALVQQTGEQSCVIQEFLHCLYKMKEKARRFWYRCEDVQWMAHDIHVYDDFLHMKMKKKEKKEGYK